MPYFRRATAADVRQYFDWANEASTRHQSYSSNSIPYAHHERWFHDKLTSENTHMYVLCEEESGDAVGQIRFEVQNDCAYAVVGYSVGEEHRGKGYGRLILGGGIVHFVEAWQAPIIVVGFVKNNNPASNRLFSQLGFVAQPTDAYPDSVRYEKQFGN